MFCLIKSLQDWARVAKDQHFASTVCSVLDWALLIACESFPTSSLSWLGLESVPTVSTRPRGSLSLTTAGLPVQSTNTKRFKQSTYWQPRSHSDGKRQRKPTPSSQFSSLVSLEKKKKKWNHICYINIFL